MTRLAVAGIAASTQNQAFHALLFFYREVLQQELGPVQALRAKLPVGVRQAITPQEVRQLLAAVSDLYGYPITMMLLRSHNSLLFSFK